MLEFLSQVPIWFYVIGLITNLPLFMVNKPERKNKLWPIITIVNTINFIFMIQFIIDDIAIGIYLMITFVALLSSISTRFCTKCGNRNIRFSKEFLCVNCKQLNE
jgi:hypothetical protein